MDEFNLDLIVTAFEESRIQELVLRRRGLELQISKSNAEPFGPAECEPVELSGGSDYREISITAPHIGTIREVGEAISQGGRISAGQIICHLDVLDQLVPIRSPENAIVVAVMAETGNLVEFGQELLTLQPA